MFSRINRSLATKLIVVVFLVLVIVLVLNGVLVLRMIASNSRDQAIGYMEALSGEYARIARSRIEEPLYIARATAIMMSTFDSVPAESRRTFFIESLKTLIEQNSHFLAVWSLWEPNALDGMDAEHLSNSALGSDSSGIFTPLIVLEDWKAEIVEPAPEAKEAYNENFYLGAKNTLREYVVEPYFHKMDGRDVLMISIVAPIIRNGRFLGVVGIDLLPELLQQDLGHLTLYETGFGRLISHNGTVVTHPYPDRIGRTAPEWRDQDPDVAEVIASGHRRTFESISLATGEISVKSLVPVSFGRSTDPWYFGTVVPPREVYAHTIRVVQIYVLATLAGILVILVVLWLLIRSFLLPLKRAVFALENIAEGEGDLTNMLAVSSRDEVGHLSQHFNRFVSSLSEIIGGLKRSVAALKNSGMELSAAMEQTSSAVDAIESNIGNVGTQILNQSAGVSEISSTIEQISRNIESLDSLIERQGSSLESSSASIEQMIANIRSVTGNVESSLVQVNELSESSEKGFKELEAVTRTVKEVAEQSRGLKDANNVIQQISARTNLLAMNAAIEAAHAGSAGKGFAVVADEIRKLAENSAAQSKQISSVLNSLKTLIDSVVGSVFTVGSSFESVRKSVEDVRIRQETIRSSMEEQTSGNQIVLESIDSLRTISHEVQSGSAEMATGSQAILGEMQHLVAITQEVQNSIDEMSRGTRDITVAITAVTALTRDNSKGIDQMEQAVGKFKIS